MNQTKGIGGHTLPNKGRTNDWLTPPEITQALGSFDLDPCCPMKMPWGTAGIMLHEGIDDGMKAEWFGRVWLNPPYGTETGKWLAKLAKHGRGTALTFARTETAMFQRHVWPWASAVLFIAKRLHFHGIDGKRSKLNCGGPSVLIAYGVEDAAALSKCGIAGQFFAFPGRFK